jgi:hypothetical protein
LTLLAIGALGAAAAAEWPGWRGLERQGRAEAGGPVHWSAEQNVQWKTPIPGKGHSSPVVVGDRVFLTTGYPTAVGTDFKRIAAVTSFLLPLLVVLAAVPAILGCCRESVRWQQTLLVPAFCLLLGLWIHFTATAHLRLGGELSLDERMDLWLFSTQGLVLCLLLGGLAVSRPLGRISVAVLALACTALFVLARPAADYYDLFQHPDYAQSLQLTALLPLATAGWLLVGALIAWRRGKNDPTLPAGALRWRRVVLASAAFLLGLAALGAPMALGAYYRVRGSAGDGIPYRWTLIPVGISALAVVGAALLMALAVDAVRLWRGGRVLPGWLAAAVVVAGAAQFAERNALQPQTEFVRALMCIDRATGKVRWTREALRGPQPTVDALNSPATPTPVVIGERVVAWFGSAGAMSTNLEGKLLWTNTELPFEGVHGVGASPLAVDGKVILYGGQPREPYLTALDPASGKRLWTTPLASWPGSEGQHRTPVAATVRGRQVLLLWGWEGVEKEDALRVYDAQTGDPLWSHPVSTNGEQVASLVVSGTTAHLLNSRWAMAIDLAKLSRGEPPELRSTDLKRKGPYASSPVLVDGRLFMVSHYGHATCLDASSGDILWRKRLGGKEYLASVVAAGDRVYFCNNRGLTTVVAAEDEFRRLAENRLPEPIVATPAPVGGRLYLRTANHLWCIGE